MVSYRQVHSRPDFPLEKFPRKFNLFIDFKQGWYIPIDDELFKVNQRSMLSNIVNNIVVLPSDLINIKQFREELFSYNR